MPRHSEMKKKLFMIKLGRRIYINPLTVVLFVFCYINRQLEMLAVTYAIMLIHETAHLLAALYIGLLPSHIVIEPFGVNLRLKNQIVYSIYDEILLYMAGPIVNIVFAFIGMIINRYVANIWLFDFAVKNFALFAINILPILPLDGGVILKKIIISSIGRKNGECAMRIISGAMVCALTTLSAVLMLKSEFNFSVVFLCVFLIMNIFVQKEKYNIDFVKELMFYKKKSGEYKDKRVRLMAVSEDDSIRSAAEKFTNNTFGIAVVVGQNNKVDGFFTEPELIDTIVSKGAEVTFKDSLK